MITEFNFILPKGLVDVEGKIHQQGVMRLTTAKDELYVYSYHDIPPNPAYKVFTMLSRVIVRLGELTILTPELLENLFIHDLAYLREFYNRINQQGSTDIPVQCPQCGTNFKQELVLSGES
ncbi:MAG: phage tail assembly protein [Richelia sp. RM2_1_2]|nr:phage tail assembly protein [Richelia sp. SM1_7_0]NJN10664.1 phage tail assembly protein [Richelia sp. RM1_1_1]NJO60558.1 phage tail assembly protein [Richelia sp. RM2_1_2]